MTPILLLGAGRMGGALIEGWLRAGAFAASDIMVRDPASPAIERVRVNPPDSALTTAKTVVLAVKPQVWREAAGAVAGLLAADAVVVSIAAGVRSADIAEVFRRRVARVMPTTAVAIGQGTASVFADDAEARARAHALLAPVATVVDLADEGLMHAATAVSGSGPAYLYAFVEALEAAGSSAGLSAKAAKLLARSTVTGAAALLADSGAEPSELRTQVTSPGGTTQAALEVLLAELPDLLARAVAAAAKRSEELGG
jgi:pyrroline-5-carboxylate reductase